MKKRILGVLIAVVMLILMLPIAVFAAGETYKISVGGVEITSTNLTVNGDTGTATYDPATSTLTLNNFSCSSDAFGGVINIQSSDSNITIKLKGNNTLTGTGEYTNGIYTNGNLVICDGEDGAAQGQLTINTKKSCIGVPSGTLEINGVKVTATSTANSGLSAESISLTDVTLSATADYEPIYADSYYLVDPETGEYVLDPETDRPVEVYGTINIENSTVEAYCTSGWNSYAFEPAPTLIGNYAVYAGNNAENATEVVAPTEDTYTESKYVRIEPVQASTITFINYDGTVLQSVQVPQGETPSYDGETPTKAADAQYSYTFAGWSPAISAVTGEATYTATYSATQNTYDVTLNTNGGDVGSQNVTTYTYGTGAPLPSDVTKTGYTFLGWYVNADFSGSAVTAIGTDETGNKSFYAKWAVNSYKVTFDANGGECDTTEQTATYDSTYGELPVPTRTGYTFLGWFTASENGNEVKATDAVTVAQDQTLYAHWEKTVYAVNGGVSENGSVDILPTTATMGDTVTVIITPDTGWEVDTVTVGGVAATYVAANKYSFTMPADHVSVDVTYKKIIYNVSLYDNGTTAGGNYSTDKVTATLGETVIITVENHLGYYIEAVKFNNTLATKVTDGQYSFVMPAENVMISVTFQIDLPAIAKELQLLNDADAGLRTAMDEGNSDLTEEIARLDQALANVKALLEDADEANKAALNEAITNAQNTLQAAIDQVAEDLEEAKADLQSKIDEKANTADVNEAIAELQAAIDALEAVKDNYASADATLKADLEGQIAAAESAAITAAETLVNNAKADLQSKIDAKANTADVNTAIAELQAAIDALDAVKDDYATADTTLKADLEGQIADAQSAAISAAEILVNNAKAELQSKIDAKANAADVSAAIAELQAAIDALEAVKDDYAIADAALKAELEGAIAKAKQEAIDAAKGYIPHIGTNGNWWIGDTDTGVDANGIKGDTGNGIASITTNKENGITTVTIKFTDPNMADVIFTIEDGAEGAKGDKGDTGDTGAAGTNGKDGLAVVSTVIGGTALSGSAALGIWEIVKNRKKWELARRRKKVTSFFENW